MPETLREPNTLASSFTSTLSVAQTACVLPSRLDLDFDNVIQMPYKIPLVDVVSRYLQLISYSGLFDILATFVFPTLLLSFAAITGVHQFFGHPVSCSLPDTHILHLKQTIENFCVERFYYTRSSDFYRSDFPSPSLYDQNGVRMPVLSYYSWTSFLFLAMAVALMLPNLLFLGSTGKCFHFYTEDS